MRVEGFEPSPSSIQVQHASHCTANARMSRFVINSIQQKSLQKCVCKKKKSSARIERGLWRTKREELHLFTTVPPRFQWKYFQLLDSNMLKILKTWYKRFQSMCVSNIIFNENISNQTSPNIFLSLIFIFILKWSNHT